jgi:LmbE family N-acetylglucosaminyl deacetylase
MLDHEQTSVLVRAAAFAAPIPNSFRECGHPPPLNHVPHLYYCDAIEGKDVFGKEIEPGFGIAIDGVIDDKTELLACHASQREWLRKHHGIDHYLISMRAWCAHRGEQCGTAFAEVFRQHLGHGYPQENLLGSLLGTL